MSNFIHPTAIVDPSVSMGEGNYIGPFCLIGPNVKIGNNNRFESHCCIGTPPEHKEFYDKYTYSVSIGSDCVMREFVTVNAGTINDTFVGDGVWMLKGCYVGHDCVVHNDVTLSCNVAMGGHCRIFEGANLGISVSVHQYAVIGHFAMLGMGTVVTKSSRIEPCKTYVGAPARFLKLNQHAIQKNKINSKKIDEYMRIFQMSLIAKTA